SDVRTLLDRVSFRGTDLQRLPYDAIRRALEEHSVVRVRGLFGREEVLAARRNVERRFDPGNDRKHDPRDPEAIRGNLQKLQVGGGPARHNVARFLRMIYTPFSAEDFYGLRSLFVRLARFRTLVSGLPPDFAVFGTDDGLWTAARLNQYPRGGGFMVAHRDR